MKYFGLIAVILTCLLGCLSPSKRVVTPTQTVASSMAYAKGFDLIIHDDFTEILINEPWPGSTSQLRYALVGKNQSTDLEGNFDQVIEVPINHIVVTSTTHIPALELLDVTHTLQGFPNLDYISSPKTRERVDQNLVLELGQNEALNIELLLQAKPDAIVTFAVSGAQNQLTLLQENGVPILYNADWTETHPLGKAEWIKFFGALYDQSARADSIFQSITTNYLQAKEAAARQEQRPSVLSGALYKDVWYLPAGESWAAQFIDDANGSYIYQNSKGTGSLQLSIEEVLAAAQQTDIWIGPGQFTSYKQLEEANQVYTLFAPFQKEEVYTFGLSVGPTGGLLYFELAAMRPDLVLRDLISIFHPALLPEHQQVYFKPINP